MVFITVASLALGKYQSDFSETISRAILSIYHFRRFAIHGLGCLHHESNLRRYLSRRGEPLSRPDIQMNNSC